MSRHKPKPPHDPLKPLGERQLAKARSLANLNKGVGWATADEIPALTPEDAAEYVKLRASGLSPVDAVSYFKPAKGPKFSHMLLTAWGARWELHPWVVAEWEKRNGGSWQDLDAMERLQLSTDINLAQMAYYLYTNDFNDPNVNLGKMREAREAIAAALEFAKGGEESKFEAFMRGLMEKVGDAGGPPVMKASVQVEQVGIKES